MPSDRLVRCDDPECSVAWAYRDPPTEHYHPRPHEPWLDDLVTAAEIAWRNVLVAESQGLQRDGCCSADTWRGHLCPYHEGFADGVDVVLDRLRAIGITDRRIAAWLRGQRP